jgi:predicted amidohydrolase
VDEERQGPRKVVVGTAMYAMWHAHPGLETRLRELSDLVGRMAREASTRFPGAGLDLAALPEVAVSGGLSGSGKDVAFALKGPVLEVMGAAARAHHCYVVVPLYLEEDAPAAPRGAAGPSGNAARYSNAAVLLGRDGNPVGVYRKVWLVVDRGSSAAEAGATPGREFPVFDCDFGRVGIQICWDMAYDEGWESMRRKGAEVVVWSTQWPGRVHSGHRALRGGCYVLTSTWRNNASLLDPTGHVIRDMRGEGVFVDQIDLDWRILTWQPSLKNGKAFDERFGSRAGYRYSEEEDCGIFWSNDPAIPVGDMVRSLDLETKAEEVERSRQALLPLRGGPPRLN